MTEESLSEKILDLNEVIGQGDSTNLYLDEEDVKEKIQNAQRRLKEMFSEKRSWKGTELLDDIDKIFLEEFGGKFVK